MGRRLDPGACGSPLNSGDSNVQQRTAQVYDDAGRPVGTTPAQYFIQHIVHLYKNGTFADADDWLACPAGQNTAEAPTSYLGMLLQTFLRPAAPAPPEAPGPMRSRPGICPSSWIQAVSQLNCGLVWLPLRRAVGREPVTLDADAYYGAVADTYTLERLVAQGGVRLAATLNDIFDSGAAPAANGIAVALGHYSPAGRVFEIALDPEWA